MFELFDVVASVLAMVAMVAATIFVASLDRWWLIVLFGGVLVVFSLAIGAASSASIFEGQARAAAIAWRLILGAAFLGTLAGVLQLAGPKLQWHWCRRPVPTIVAAGLEMLLIIAVFWAGVD